MSRKVACKLGALLVVVASCSSSTPPLFVAVRCTVSGVCYQPDPFCDRRLSACTACPTDPAQYHRCEAGDGGADCFPSEDCRDFGAGIGFVCVPRLCACAAEGERTCDPTSAADGCGTDEKCLAREVDGGVAGRCVPYSCGWCDSSHPCTGDPSKPYCYRPTGEWPTCAACPNILNDLHQCDPTNPDRECFGDEICLAHPLGAATPGCLPNACRCQSPPSRCDPTSTTSGCRTDEECVLEGVGTLVSPQCVPYACGVCDPDHPCTDPSMPFCGPVPRDTAEQQVYGIRFFACTANAPEDGGESPAQDGGDGASAEGSE